MCERVDEKILPPQAGKGALSLAAPVEVLIEFQQTGKQRATRRKKHDVFLDRS